MSAIICSPNFEFLATHSPTLHALAANAERYVFDDPNTTLIKCRQLAESFAKGVAAYLGIPFDADSSFRDVERELRDRRVLDGTLQQIMRDIRIAGNKAVHEVAGTQGEALHKLKLTRQLAIWYFKSVSRNSAFKAGPFSPPPNPADADDELKSELQRLREQLAKSEAEVEGLKLSKDELAERVAETEKLAELAFENERVALEIAAETEETLTAKLAEYVRVLPKVAAETTQQSEAERQQVIDVVQQSTRDIDLDEADTRRLIDQQLRDAGWEADTDRIRHSKGIRPQKNKNLAIAEWPNKNGYADYVLFCGLTPVATVEAKRDSVNVAGIIEQARRYSKGLESNGEFQLPDGSPWNGHQVPFLFATNGRPYLAQIQEASGIWFQDVRDPNNHPRALDGWYTPDGLVATLEQDSEAANQKLETDPVEAYPVRFYQQEAIKSVEDAIQEGRREILLAMATGTGKTRTCIALIYRLVKANRFRRVLFLVDRSALAEQATDAFKDVRLEQQQTFDDVYDIKEIGDLKPDKDTRLHITTVQGTMKRIMDDSLDSTPLPVDSYDLIVIDECHRGYNLDAEMTEQELVFRSEQDYISKYRRVIEHFDAVKVGLTATPALHTTEIFGSPVYNYSYRQAVIDGYLCDYEPPFRFKTRLGEEGIHWEQGDEVKVYNTATRQTSLYRTPDEIEVNIDKFNVEVLTESFNRVICQELCNHIDFEGPEKTLIFCVNDLHADLVVRVLKEALDEFYGSFPDAAVQKITGKADKPLEKIRHFRNEKDPRVAVTVDLLTTGIDVEPITNLIFIRRIKSRILFDQMMGRATRLCPELYGPKDDKKVFRVFDAVGIYDDLQQMSEMQPVVSRPKFTFAQLATELQTIDDPEFLATVKEEFLGKLRRKQLTEQQESRLQLILSNGSSTQ